MNQFFLGVVPKVCPIFILHIKIKVEVFFFFSQRCVGHADLSRFVHFFSHGFTVG